MRAPIVTIMGLSALLGCGEPKQDVGDEQATDTSTSSTQANGTGEGGTDTGDGDGDGDGDPIEYGMPGEGCSPDVYECLPKAVVCQFSVPEAIDCGALATSDPAEDWVAAHQCFVDAAMAGLPVFVLSTINGVDGDYLYGHAVSPGLVDGGIEVEYHPYTGLASKAICGAIGPQANCQPGKERLCLDCVDHVKYETVCEATLPP